MAGEILLDTCAAIWISDEEPLSAGAKKALETSAAARLPVMVSVTSAWEMGMLLARKSASSAMSAHAWFDALVLPPFSQAVELSTAVLINASFLPGRPPRDPFDRLFISTAREHGYRIMTRDRKILDYAEQGHVQAIPC